MRIFILCLCLLIQGLFFSFLPAQTPGPEELHVVFDKTFYASGEDVWYSVQFQGGDHPSNVVYTELIAPDGSFLSRQTLLAKGQNTPGDIALDPALPTGYYEFRAYTAWNLNFQPQIVYRTYLPIYHPNESIIASVPAPDAMYEPAEGKGLVIQTNQASYKRRDSVWLNLSPELASRAQTGHVVLTVTDVRYETPAEDPNSNWQVEEMENPVPQSDMVPEKEFTLHFEIKYPESQQAVNSSFVYAFVKATQQKVIQKARNGVVSFSFGEFYDSTIVQVFDADPFLKPYIPDVKLLPTPQPEVGPIPLDSEPPMTQAVGHYLSLFRKRFQVNALFESNQQIRAQRSRRRILDLEPTTSYPVDAFPPVKDMKRFFREVVNPARVAKAGEIDRIQPQQSKRFKLYIPHKYPLSSKEVKKSALLLVNDYFTYDAQSVLEMEWSAIEQIDVFNSARMLPVQFGPIGSFGVIAFYTRDGITPAVITDAPNNLTVPGFYRTRKFPSPTSLDPFGLSRVPFLSPMMHWEPDLSLPSDQPTRLGFVAGDQAGLYLVRVQGFWEDGSRILGETLIEVK